MSTKEQAPACSEEKIIEDISLGTDISVERSLFIVAGLEDEIEIQQYTRKLDQIHSAFLERASSRDPSLFVIPEQYSRYARARLLFEYLWASKPRRCNGHFLLTDVIDAQLDPRTDLSVGKCIGLTSLYTVLGLKENLDLTILVSGEHVLNRLKVDQALYNIENTDPLGFDCEIDESSFAERPAVYLLAHVLNSRGMAREKLGDLSGAIKDFDTAIQVNPEYANAINNRANIKTSLADYAGAIRDYDRAIRLNPGFYEAYCNRGMARAHLGDYSGALEDFDRALAINPQYTEADASRSLVKKKSG